MSLFIAIPCFGGKCHAGFTRSLLQLKTILIHHKIEHKISFLEHESLISRGRNTLVAEFYACSSNTYLLFLDSDLIFNPNAVLKMISENKELIGCPYPKKQFNFKKIEAYVADNGWENIEQTGLPYFTDINYNLIDEPNVKELTTNNSVLEANDIPTGFMLINRSVITALIIAYPERQYINNIAGIDKGINNYFYDFFGTGVVNGIYLSEDYFFCNLVRAIGIKCYLETAYSFGHIGSLTYYGNLALQLNNDITDKNNSDKILLNSIKNGAEK
jgi:hypothetical protein